LRCAIAMRADEVPELRLSGDLDIATVPQLESCLQVWTGGRGSAALDLSGISFFDSSAVGVLVDWYSRLSASGGTLTIEATSPHVEAVLSAMDLLHLFRPGESPAGCRIP
jgi:anti-sigma B factor antagonist